MPPTARKPTRSFRGCAPRSPSTNTGTWVITGPGPADGRWIALTPSRTGVRLSLGGYGGLTIAWVEGLEINLLGAVVGLDLRRPALQLPGLGRLGLSAQSGRKLEASEGIESPYKDLQYGVKAYKSYT